MCRFKKGGQILTKLFQVPFYSCSCCFIFLHKSIYILDSRNWLVCCNFQLRYLNDISVFVDIKMFFFHGILLTMPLFVLKIYSVKKDFFFFYTFVIIAILLQFVTSFHTVHVEFYWFYQIDLKWSKELQIFCMQLCILF